MKVIAKVSIVHVFTWTFLFWHCKYTRGYHLTMMLRAPNGVTRMAGANAYAAKLAISPTTIVVMPAHHKGSTKYE